MFFTFKATFVTCQSIAMSLDALVGCESSGILCKRGRDTLVQWSKVQAAAEREDNSSSSSSIHSRKAAALLLPQCTIPGSTAPPYHQALIGFNESNLELYDP